MQSSIYSKALLLVLLAVFCSACSYFVAKQSVPKIGYVETPVLLQGFVGSEEARLQFVEAQKSWDINLKLFQDSIRAQVDLMNKSYNSMSPAQQSGARGRLDSLQDAFEEYQRRVKQLSVTKEQELMTPVLSKVNAFLKEWGDANGYTMVFGTLQGGNILYADTNANVTQAVLKDLNAKYQRLPQAPAAK